MCEPIIDLDAEKYGRQLVLRHWGVQKQIKISKKCVLLVGVGGLGSTIALYLAGSGVGKLGLMDGDIVETSNLHRQIIHTEEYRGVSKVKSAMDKCLKLNSKANIEIFEHHLDAHTAEQIIPNYDVVIDGTDNPQAKYLLNDVCVLYGKPLVAGSALNWEGQLSVYNYNNGPCLRCVYAHPPSPDVVQGCDIEGVMGPIPGIIGNLQAIEAIKICGEMKENVLSGKLLIYDALNPTNPFRCIKLRSKNKMCKVCGENSELKSLKDYQVNWQCPSLMLPKIELSNTITVETFSSYFPHFIDPSKSKLDNNTFLLDVRPQLHFDVFHLPHSINWPLSELLYDIKTTHDPKQLVLDRLNINEDINFAKVIIVCRKGNDSTRATDVLIKQFINTHSLLELYNLIGGLHTLKRVVPNIPLL